MNAAEFAERMAGIAASSDIEMRHGDADDLMVTALIQFGYAEGCEIFEAMRKWYA